jgi:cob(I)alamin adenosyltransferase
MDAADEADRNERHRQRMEKKKAVVDAKIAQAVEERGVIVVATGNGKGKSTSGFGMLARALGHGMQVGVVQFIKGSFSTGEEAFFRRFPEVRYYVMGEGYTWETQDRERDIAKAGIAWKIAAEMLSDAAIQLVLLDELNIVLKLGYLQVVDVIAALERRSPMQHVMITGRGAPPELIEVADTVTQMQPIKHAFDAGVRAQKGVEL